MPRKIAFSGKKKKVQIAQKRIAKKANLQTSDSSDEGGVDVVKKQVHSLAITNKTKNRYDFKFFQESKEELHLIRKESFKSIQKAQVKDREIDGAFYDGYDFPVRPAWNYKMNKSVLDANENRYFREYIESVQKIQENKDINFSLFELNLETWRQLWRVLEFSDILLIIVDVRFSALMFPPSLYNYITKILNKHAILVLNKVDLVLPEVVIAWKQYFHENYPELPIVLFASFIKKRGEDPNKIKLAYKRSFEGVHNIFRCCQEIVQDAVNLTCWEKKINEDAQTEDICLDSDATETTQSTTDDFDWQQEKEEHVMFKNGILTIGCIGFPNVGKSSLINALKGRKVVHISRTPGATKHFQTIFLTNVVRLCDCPGLVFPSSTPKYIQVLLGSYPISQIKVPYQALKFMAEHLDLPTMLKLRLPEDFEDWSAAAIADAWAIKRGYILAKAAKPDRYRAANQLLRMCLAGNNIILQFYPKGFEDNKNKLMNHPDLKDIKVFQDVSKPTEYLNNEGDDSSCSQSEDESKETSEDKSDGNDGAANNAFALLDDE